MAAACIVFTFSLLHLMCNLSCRPSPISCSVLTAQSHDSHRDGMPIKRWRIRTVQLVDDDPFSTSSIERAYTCGHLRASMSSRLAIIVNGARLLVRRPGARNAREKDHSNVFGPLFTTSTSVRRGSQSALIFRLLLRVLMWKRTSVKQV